MQSIINAVSNTVGTISETVTSGVAALTGSHPHNEEAGATSAALPPDYKASPVDKIDSESLAVFEDEDVRHDILVKLNKLAIDDERHGLKELAGLDLVTATNQGPKKGIDYYHPLRFFTVQRPNGVDYIGEVELEKGKSIHVRVHKASPTAKPTFHSIDTRPGSEGGAVYKTGDALVWFDY